MDGPGSDMVWDGSEGVPLTTRATQFVCLHQIFILRVNKLISMKKNEAVHSFGGFPLTFVGVLVNLKDIPVSLFPLSVLYKPRWRPMVTGRKVEFLM